MSRGPPAGRSQRPGAPFDKEQQLSQSRGSPAFTSTGSLRAPPAGQQTRKGEQNTLPAVQHPRGPPEPNAPPAWATHRPTDPFSLRRGQRQSPPGPAADPRPAATSIGQPRLARQGGGPVLRCTAAP
ncbi:hypothetical protein NDU88_003696 [Pleurodeles waltl]|uniref:Uncharacterized protein n=1 Tax=Pleurodeles waltl TaxID=8319 RepID=A0AAV7L2I6_PLEWA|nr:hypothetical protein NDU88_003696 [Pleurodeles waltl]